MEIKFYNTLSKQVETFVPLQKDIVTMYVCGPTVYDEVHIGNMRPVVVFDVLRRFLQTQGYRVMYASNYTDVDDKIIAKAQVEGVDEHVITTKYIKAFEDNLHKINSLIPTFTPKATEHIDDIIAFIDVLVKKGAAYVVDDEVFFRVTSDPHYGELSHINHDDLLSGARVEENSKKENPADFLLWKKTDVGIKWASPWGSGRPGWHTECVAMINSIFAAKLIDIHGGGFDLKFPHHENEVAQSQIYNGTHLANFWLHNGFITLDNQKMSKSLGNVIKAKDLLDTYGGNVVRLAIISTHYRAPVNFSDEILLSSQKEIDKITRSLRQATVYLQSNGIAPVYDESQVEDFYRALGDDLNTANALTSLYATIGELNKHLRVKQIDNSLVAKLYAAIVKMLYVLGLQIDLPHLSKDDIILLEEFNLAKANKDFARSDRLRLLLQQRNIL